MRDKHIIPLLGNQFWTASEAARVEMHIAQCADCRRAYLAMHASRALLKARAAEEIAPSPFFATRVMAAIREQQNEPSLFDLVALWKAARASLVSTVSVVVLLAGLTFMIPQSSSGTRPELWQTTTEGVVFGDDVSRLAETNDDQVVDVVFTPEEADASDQK